MASRMASTAVLSAAPLRAVVLVVLLLTQTPVVPAVVVAAALIDGGHRIECSVNGGLLHVHLAHWQPAGLGQSVPDHPAWLCLFVRPAPHHPDHLYDFAPPELARGEKDGLRATADEVGVGPACVLLPGFLAPPSPAVAAWSSHRQSTRQHDPLALLGELRSVVLRV